MVSAESSYSGVQDVNVGHLFEELGVSRDTGDDGVAGRSECLQNVHLEPKEE
jgi:hypothetical protein